ncbi:MAG: TetR/AcrR family transcriptional regulator [Nocardiaceae bacterium]|nr:TetR/AcrR family transcriptional regulator [Nocardiaceae bacterium]
MTLPRPADDRPRRRYAPRLPPDARRAQLLDAAFEVLQCTELHELSMEAVARSAGVGKPVLYTVFKTRAELVAALLERERAKGMQEVVEMLPSTVFTSDPVTVASETVEGFLNLVLANPTRWRFILTAPTNAPDEYRAALQTAHEQIVDQIDGLVRIGVALEPRLSAIDSMLMTLTLLNVVEMLGRIAVSEPDEFPKERLQGFVRSFVRALTGAP